MESTNKKHRRQYTQEFKSEAVRLVMSKERSLTEASRNLGVATSTLSKWCQHEGTEVLSNVSQKDLAAENKRLEAENRRLKLEQEILKKAAAYFAKNLM